MAWGMTKLTPQDVFILSIPGIGGDSGSMVLAMQDGKFRVVGVPELGIGNFGGAIKTNSLKKLIPSA